jgi:hypothetical protein
MQCPKKLSVCVSRGMGSTLLHGTDRQSLFETLKDNLLAHPVRSMSDQTLGLEDRQQTVDLINNSTTIVTVGARSVAIHVR